MLDGTPQNRLVQTIMPTSSSSLADFLNEGVNDMLLESEPSAGFAPSPAPAPTLAIPPENGGQKRRAQTWVTEETECLISLRRGLHRYFNNSKSNKHLWEYISEAMREKGWARTPAMCTEKWRNLLKEYKKVAPPPATGGSGEKREVRYDELEAYCREKKCCNGGCKKLRVSSPLEIPDKGIGEGSFLLRPVKVNDRPLNVERNIYNGGVCEPEEIFPTEFPSQNWRGPPSHGGAYVYTTRGRVISVRRGECVKRIGINASTEAIKEAIESYFRLKNNRSYWLEDEEGIIRSIDRNMPLRNYTLHLDEGISMTICLHNDPNHTQCHIVEKTFYNEDCFRDYLSFRGWIGLKDSGSQRTIDSLDDVHAGELYHGCRIPKN
ncbi:hypothetical protein NMG60_11002864 [Bertholletia excelsa]